MKIKTKDRQSLPDIALQTSGSVETVFALAEKNGLAVSDPLPIGTELETAEAVSRVVVERYAAKKTQPATALTAAQTEGMPYGGIGYMAIEIDFIVS